MAGNQGEIKGYFVGPKAFTEKDQNGKYRLVLAIPKPNSGRPDVMDFVGSLNVIDNCVKSAMEYVQMPKPKGKGVPSAWLTRCKPLYFKDGDAPPDHGQEDKVNDFTKGCYIFFLQANVMRKVEVEGRIIEVADPIPVTKSFGEPDPITGAKQLMSICPEDLFYGDKLLVSFAATVNSKYGKPEELNVQGYANAVRVIKHSEFDYKRQQMEKLAAYVPADGEY